MSTFDLSTSYLGLKLRCPLMPGASPMVEDLGTVKRLEDAGAGAIVMYSLFEEQIAREQMGAHRYFDGSSNSNAEAASYFPPSEAFALGPDKYLEQIRKIREAVAIPVIASLNGTTPGGWIDYAKSMQDAGAHALELNLYTIPTDADEDGAAIEARGLDVVREVRRAVTIPLAVKLSPFYSSLPAFVRKLERAGANGVILFNRFYQPDIDAEALDVVRTIRLSDPTELLLRLRWLAIVSPQTKLSIAASGGVHGALDAIKALMSGAHVVQIVSALLRQGPSHLRFLRDQISTWLVEHEYESLKQLVGSMSLAKCPDPAGYERANYVHVLQSWRSLNE